MDIVEKRLIEIIANRTEIDLARNDSLKKEALLGEKIHIPPRELVLIYFDIEKEFNIEIPEEEILQGSLKTFEKIYNMIGRLLP